ncbi:MAG: metallophosphoesterase, partial [Dehalococcoidia bacterium]
MRFKISRILITILLCVCMLGGATACSNHESFTFRYESDTGIDTLLRQEVPAYPEVSFVVFSDPHLYNPLLGLEGEALETYLSYDRKLLRESTEILEAAIERIMQEKATIVLVPGDLTKDGERISHELMADYLSEIEDKGKQVYVIPGNHDVDNGHSFKYIGADVESVPSVSAGEFAEIYNEFGYGEAVYRDPASLSYVAGLNSDLWLLALDSCLYRENVSGEEPVTDGRFTDATLRWIEEMLIKAAEENTAVIAMMHHGVVEHYNGQEKNFGEYIVHDYPAVSKLLATYNVRLVFTGHYHAQDITVVRRTEGEKFLFDVETGALVTYPCPYRLVDIDSSQKAEVRTGHIESIASYPEGFPGFTRAYITKGIENIALLAIQKYKVKQAQAEKLAGQVSEAFV